MGKTRPREQENLELIDLVRGFAILSVLLFHFVLGHVTAMGGPSLFRWISAHFWINGAYGVQVFFVV
ncbi:MAG TPA: hypothetical protein VFR02_00865, partial [bacterium]|nr:hypothetical protein [bacterium]